ncbi:hypothetical protein MC885_002251 [Smutsia gigantea]|nr:hypothetical protein MC885_002251 [Smutsia gigantea]
MQLFVHTQELHTLEVTSQETVTQIKGITPEDQVVFLAGTPLEDEATLVQCGVEALTILEKADCMLEGKSPWFLGPCWKSNGHDSQGGQKGEKEEDRPGHAVNAIQRHLHQSCAHLWQEEGPQCQLLNLCYSVTSWNRQNVVQDSEAMVNDPYHINLVFYFYNRMQVMEARDQKKEREEARHQKEERKREARYAQMVVAHLYLRPTQGWLHKVLYLPPSGTLGQRISLPAQNVERQGTGMPSDLQTIRDRGSEAAPELQWLNQD